MEGNVGNTRFLGGNVAVSGQIVSLGNVTAPFFIGNGSQLTGVTATLPSVVTADIRGNLIGVYANVANIIAVEGNVGNTRFLGGNVAVSGEIGSLGNVTAPFFIGNGSQLTGVTATLPSIVTADIRGNLIGVYANVANIIAVEGNVGNTRFLGGNVAVSGQINVLGSVVAPFFIGENRGNLIGVYANVSNIIAVEGNVGNTRFLGGNVAVSGQVNVLGNVVSSYFIGPYISNTLNGNVRIVGSNIMASGQINALGNVVASFFIGNIIAIQGNIGNTRFLGGNVAVSGQVNVLGSVVAPFFIGENRGNLIGVYANVSNIIAVEGNVGNTRFLGGNVAVSGQVNVLGSVAAPFFIGENRGNLIGVYANVSNIIAVEGNVGNTRFLGGNVAVSGQVNVLGNVVANCFIGNGSQLTGLANALPGVISADIRGNIIGNYANVTDIICGNTTTINCTSNSNVLTVNVPTATGFQQALIQGTTLRGAVNTYSFLRLDNSVGRVLDIDGTGAISATAQQNTNVLTLLSNAGGFTGAVIQANALRGASPLYSFLRFSNSFGNILDVRGTGAIIATTPVNDNVFTINSTIGSYSNTLVYLSAERGITDAYSFMRFDAGNGATRVFEVQGTGAMISNCAANQNAIDVSAIIGGYTSSVLNLRVQRTETATFNFINCTAGTGATTPFTVNGIGDVNTTGEIDVAGNVNITRNLACGNIATITCASNANVLTVNSSTLNTNGTSLIQATTIRGNSSLYSMLRLETAGGRILDVNGNGEMYISSPSLSDMVSITSRTSSFVGNALSIVVPKLSFSDYNFINCRNSNGALFIADGRGMITATSVVNSNVIVLNASNASSVTYTSDVVRIQASATGTGFNMISARNGAGNVFRVNGAGGVFGVGTFNTTGADYAEMFEWEDGNANDEDRRGITVVLGNNGMIRKSSITDSPVDVIGVVSVNPSVLGDTKWNEWGGRYLRDKFGAKLSNTLYYIANVSNEYDRVRCGINDAIPYGYEMSISSEYILNPKYDPTDAYVSRENRPEWSPIGLVGKLRVLPDQVVNPGWKLLKSYKHPDGDTLEYLVK